MQATRFCTATSWHNCDFSTITSLWPAIRHRRESVRSAADFLSSPRSFITHFSGLPARPR